MPELTLDVEVEREPHRHQCELREVGDLHSQCSRWRPFSPSSPLLSSWPLDLPPLYPPSLLFSLRWDVLLGRQPSRRCSGGGIFIWTAS
jgi:hypothetical protein